jgi:CRISPR-associated protein Cmr6
LNGRRAVLNHFAPGAGTHAGLWLDQGLDRLKESAANQAHLEGLLQRLRVPVEYPRFFERWQGSLTVLPPHTLLAPATARGRIVVGLGAESILETSIALHRTWGVPYLPGSALKGLAAAAAHRHLAGQDWRKARAGEPIGPSHRMAFGDTESAGYVVFHDALWIPQGSALPLDLDAMTVHHPEYYGGQDVPPADWDSPKPVPFLSARGSYLLAVTGPEDWAEAALEILAEALEEDGIGAKTAAGYGRMEVPWLAERRRAASATADPEPKTDSSASSGAAVAGPKPDWSLSWETEVHLIGRDNAAQKVQLLLDRLSDEERLLAAQHLVKKLERKFLRDPKRQDKAWVRALLEAAGEP